MPLAITCPRRLTDRPEVPLALPASLTRNLHETLVQTEVMSDRVLPALLVLLVVGKVVHDELVDLGEGQPLLGSLLDGHGDEGDVAEGRLGVGVRVFAGVGRLGGRRGGFGRRSQRGAGQVVDRLVKCRQR